MREVVVFDTNVLFSAILSAGGNPSRYLALARMGVVQSVTCEEILDEFAEKLREKLDFTTELAELAANEVRVWSVVAAISGTLQAVPADPDDDKVIECALAGGASCVVTGDKRHLLPLGQFQGVRIINPSEFLRVVERIGGEAEERPCP